MAKPVKRSSIRGRLALGVNRLAQSLGGFGSGEGFGEGGHSGGGGYAAGRRSTRRTRGWRPRSGSAAGDILPDLATLRSRSRDLERNNPLAIGAIQTKTNGVVGTGLKLRSVIDGDVLGIEDPIERARLQYQIEREWEIFEREADFAGQLHLKSLQRLIYRSAKVSGDIGIARRWRKRPGETYGTRIVLIEADRVSNPHDQIDGPTLQGGVALSAEGEVLGYYVTDRHPGDIMAGPLTWSFVPKRGPASGAVQMLMLGELYRPGQVRGVPLFAPVEEDLKQLDDYRQAESKAALNDAHLFATEETPAEVDDEGNPIVTRPDGEQDAAGELTLQDLMITTLPPGSKLNIRSPSRPNTAFDAFFTAGAKIIGTALGLPLEVFLMFFGSSFSASRGALELARKGFLVDQEELIRGALDVIREWQFTEMVATGRFEAPGFFEDPIKRAAWLGRVWVGPTGIQINPGVESSADKTDVEMGAKTLEQVMTERTGGDFDTKSRQTLHEREVLGTTATVAAAPPASKDKGAQQQNDGSADGTAKTNDGTDQEQTNDA